MYKRKKSKILKVFHRHCHFLMGETKFPESSSQLQRVKDMISTTKEEGNSWSMSYNNDSGQTTIFKEVGKLKGLLIFSLNEKGV